MRRTDDADDDLRENAAAGARATRIATALAAASALIVAAAGMTVAWDAQAHYWRDVWVHAAVLREWAAGDLLHPANPHYASPAPSREYTPWHLGLVLVMRATGLSAFDALRLAGGLDALLLHAAAFAFFARLFASRLAGGIAVLAAFGAWGAAPEFVGFFNLRAQVYDDLYPAAAALALALAIWTLLLAALARPRAPVLLAIAALTALLTVIHQLTAGWALGGAALFVLLQPGAAAGARARAGLAVAAGAALAALWPIYNPWTVVAAATRGDPQWAGPPQFESPGFVARLLVVQLAGLLPLLHPRSARRLLPVSLGFAGCFGAYLLGAATGNPITHRLLPLAALFLSIGLTALALGLAPGARGWVPAWAGRARRPAWAALCAAGLLLAGAQLATVARDVVEHRLAPPEPVAAWIAGLAAAIPPGTVAIAPPNLALALTAHGIKTVAVARGLYIVPDEASRQADARRFFDPAADAAERRAVLARHGVGAIVFRDAPWDGEWRFDRLDPAVVAALAALDPARRLPGHLVLILPP